MWAHAPGRPGSAAYEKEREKSASLPTTTCPTSKQRDTPPTFSGRKGSCPGSLGASRSTPEPEINSRCTGKSPRPKPREDGVRGWNDSSSACLIEDLRSGHPVGWSLIFALFLSGARVLSADTPRASEFMHPPRPLHPVTLPADAVLVRGQPGSSHCDPDGHLPATNISFPPRRPDGTAYATTWEQNLPRRTSWPN